MTDGARAGHRAAFGAVLLMLAIALGLTAIGARVVHQRADAGHTPGLWAVSDAIAFRARFDPTAGVPRFKWRAGVNASYTGTDWAWGEVQRTPVEPNHRIDVFSAEGDAPVPIGRKRIEITITPEGFMGPTILGPSMVEKVDLAVEAVATTGGHWYSSIETTEAAREYTVSAAIPPPPGSPGGLSEARLRAAGTSYSAELLGQYTALPEGALGPAATRLLEEVRSAVPSGRDPHNPYDLARTMETYIRDPGHFAYATDVRTTMAERCGGVSTIECFAIIRQGYCEHSAGTMTVLLRRSGVPARIAYGFLPGDRDATGNEIVTGARAHWWVEVYFPGIGWFEFDPDGGLGEPQVLPPGAT
jgi:transglutaminase superfamily protein